MKNQVLICGGTFDLLHAGHKYFLQEILDLAEKVIIGLTSDKYVLENKPNKGVNSYFQRKKNLELFLERIGAGQRISIIPINDIYGPLLDPNFKADALAVSEHRENAMKINSERQSRGFTPLEVIEINLKRGGDRKKVSSTRIRKGETDREGRNLFLPSTLRPLLQDVWGEIVSEIPSDIDSNKTITIGDVTTAKFRDLKIFPKISIIDFMVNRKPIPETKFEDSKIIKVKNPAGTISNELSKAIQEALEDNARSVIIVDGEEDLAVLPALLYAPLDYEIFYGQPNVGLVKITVGEEIKRKARKLIEKFEKA